jgi:hypothetical protein
VNQVLRSFRNAWTPEGASGIPKGAFGFTLGGEDGVGGARLGYIASLTYKFDQEIRDREARAQAVADGQGGTIAQNEYTGQTGRRSVLWGGIFNLSTKLETARRIQLHAYATCTA